MNRLSKKIRQTGVNLLSTVFILSTVTPQAALAGEDNNNGGGKSNVQICSERHKDDSAIENCVRNLTSASSGKDKCETAKTAIADAEKEALDACRKSGMGTAVSCVKKAFECRDEAENSYEDDTESGVYGFANTIQTITGQTIDKSGLSSGGSCPQYGGKDYADRKEALDDKLKQLKEELAGLTQDISDAKSEYSKEKQRIQADMNEAQAELDKQKDQLSEQQQQELAAQQKQMAADQENLDAQNMKKLDLEGKLAQARIDQATELIKYSDSAVSVECLKQAQDYKASVKALYKKGSGAGGLVSSGKSVNTAAAAKAKACVETFQKARIKIMTAAGNQQKLIAAEIESTTNKIANLKIQINTAAENFGTTKERQTAAQKKAEEQVVKKMQLAMQELNTLQTKLEDDLKAIGQKQTNLNQAIAAVNQSMSELTAGGKPKSGTEESMASASATVGDQVDIIDRYLEDSGYSECNLSSQYTKGKKRSSSSSNRNRSTPAKGSGSTGGVN